MTQEEKAKAYDKAYKKVAVRFGSNVADEIFPELKESEDERIRKALIDGFTVMKESKNCSKTFSNHNIPVADILTWLENQGEQKTVDEIAKEVCKNKTSAMAFLKSAGIINEKGELAEQYRQEGQKPAEEYNITGIRSKNAQGKLGEMIKKLKPVNEVLERGFAWSEEDEKQARQIERIVHDDGCTQKLQKQIAEWLKSLKDRVQPQNTWKPSDEQMHYLSWVANIKLGDSVVEQEVSKHLNELLEDLKKLKDEK